MTYEKIYKELLKKVKNDYGKPCKCKWACFSCPVCEAYLSLSFLQEQTHLEKNK